MINQSTPVIDQYIAKIKLKSSDFTLEEVESFAQKLVKGLELKVLKKTSHAFEPCGITLIFILAQSHLAIHTWPESGLLHIDLVSCAKIDGEKFKKLLVDIFNETGLLSVEVKHLSSPSEESRFH